MLTDIKHNCITIVPHNYKTHNTWAQYYEPHCVNPVSYTHLDVYKRQKLYRVEIPVTIKHY